MLSALVLAGIVGATVYGLGVATEDSDNPKVPSKGSKRTGFEDIELRLRSLEKRLVEQQAPKSDTKPEDK